MQVVARARRLKARVGEDEQTIELVLLERKTVVERHEDDECAANHEQDERDDDPVCPGAGADDDGGAGHDENETRAEVGLAHDRGKRNEQRGAELHVVAELLDAPVELSAKGRHQKDRHELSDL